MPRVPGQGMSTGPEPSWPFSSPSMETKSRMPDDQYFQSSYSCRVNIVKPQKIALSLRASEAHQEGGVRD